MCGPLSSAASSTAGKSGLLRTQASKYLEAADYGTASLKRPLELLKKHVEGMKVLNEDADAFDQARLYVALTKAREAIAGLLKA